MVEPIRLLLVDSQTLFRRCLATVLNRRRRLRVVGEASNGGQALTLVQTLQPDLVIVEPEVPDGGAKLVAALCEATPSCAVLVLTLPGEDGAAIRALQAGARGYFQKDCEPEDLMRGIDRVVTGELVVTPTLADRIVQDLGGGDVSATDHPDLTARELEVLQLVVLGRTNAEIARELNITEHTAKAHLAKIRSKLGLTNRVQITAYALQQGVARPADLTERVGENG